MSFGHETTVFDFVIARAVVIPAVESFVRCRKLWQHDFFSGAHGFVEIGGQRFIRDVEHRVFGDFHAVNICNGKGKNVTVRKVDIDAFVNQRFCGLPDAAVDVRSRRGIVLWVVRQTKFNPLQDFVFVYYVDVDAHDASFRNGIPVIFDARRLDVCKIHHETRSRIRRFNNVVPFGFLIVFVCYIVVVAENFLRRFGVVIGRIFQRVQKRNKIIMRRVNIHFSDAARYYFRFGRVLGVFFFVQYVTRVACKDVVIVTFSVVVYETFAATFDKERTVPFGAIKLVSADRRVYVVAVGILIINVLEITVVHFDLFIFAVGGFYRLFILDAFAKLMNVDTHTAFHFESRRYIRLDFFLRKFRLFVRVVRRSRRIWPDVRFIVIACCKPYAEGQYQQ